MLAVPKEMEKAVREMPRDAEVSPYDVQSKDLTLHCCCTAALPPVYVIPQYAPYRRTRMR